MQISQICPLKLPSIPLSISNGFWQSWCDFGEVSFIDYFWKKKIGKEKVFFNI